MYNVLAVALSYHIVHNSQLTNQKKILEHNAWIRDGLRLASCEGVVAGFDQTIKLRFADGGACAAGLI